MFNALLTAVVAFVSTNLDDIFVLMLFFVQCSTVRQKLDVLAGQYLGIGVLVLISLLGAAGLQFVPQDYVRLLGLVPIALGMREWLAYRNHGDNPDEDETAPSGKFRAGNVMLVAIANGADNIGVYIPLFTGFSSAQTVLFVIVFAVMTALWCFLGAKLADLPALKRFLQKYKPALVPVVYIALGLYILIGG